MRASTSIPSLLLFLLLLHQTSAAAAAASAFAAVRLDRHRYRSHHPTSLGKMDEPTGSTSSTLRYRGGSANVSSRANRSTARAKLDAAADDGLEQRDKIARDALQSIRFCSKACLFAFAGDVLITFLDDNLWKKFFGANSRNLVSWTDYVDVLDTCNVLIFGLGLTRIGRVYEHFFRDRTSPQMSDGAVIDLLRTLAVIWRAGAMTLGAVSVSMGASLQRQLQETAGFTVVSGWNPFTLPVAVFGLLMILNFGIRSWCAREADTEDQLDRERRGAVANLSHETLDLTRDLGFRAFRNQALCAGSFAVMGLMEFLSWAQKIDVSDAAGIVDRVFAIPQFATPVAITGLLFALNRKFLTGILSIIRSLGGSSKDQKIDEDAYDGLFAAQTNFYGKLGETLKDATIFAILPYAIGPFMPYIISAAEKIAPDVVEKISGLF